MSLTTHLSFVLVAFSEPWRADQLGQLVRAVRPGARVVQVNDGHAALTVCKRQVPSLMIADGELDGLDGRALLQELRRHGPTQKLACILVSERMDLASVQAVRPLRLAGYLGKPCNFDDLRQRLDRLLPQTAAVTRTHTDTPSGTLNAFLDRMREHNRGAPLLASVQAAVGDCLSAGSLDLGALDAQFARDPQITARLIGLANSAASHQGLSCQTLGQALPRLARISHSPAHWAVLTDAGRRRWRRLPTALISGKRLRARLNKALAAGWTGCDVEGDGGCAAVSAPRRSRHRRRDRTPPAAGRPNSWPL